MMSDDNWSRQEPELWKPIIQERGSGFLMIHSLNLGVGTSRLASEYHLIQNSPNSSTPNKSFAESSAESYFESREIERKLDRILDLAASENFEDGMENRMSQALHIFIAEYSVIGIQRLAIRLKSEHMNQGVAADIVRVLGQIKHDRTHHDRLHMAECLLYSQSPMARDAGALALGDMADRRSILALERAIKEESVHGLKADMQAILDELMTVPDGTHS